MLVDLIWPSIFQTSQKRRYIHWNQQVQPLSVLVHAGYELRQPQYPSYLLSCYGQMLNTSKDSNAGNQRTVVVVLLVSSFRWLLLQNTIQDLVGLSNRDHGQLFHWISVRISQTAWSWAWSAWRMNISTHNVLIEWRCPSVLVELYFCINSLQLLSPSLLM